MSPHFKYLELTDKLDKFMRDIDKTSRIITICAFNMTSVTQLSKAYNGKVEKHSKEKYNLRQTVRD